MADDSLPVRRAQRPRGPRTSQACTRCRSGKIRCDGKMPTCSPCADRGHRCVYSAAQKVRGPGKR
ncbi:hypothetical protein C8A01DRAFT_21474 [Parachaetomium inaequale]|uniref:Zn(2)-C6 fungal-type domain-containing protein n=1 Tax=Parachaetomium inaequale TaxID=2588326 RepID=A0AAN6SL22_9PEZI|nr:hypothetical protein C8A01DRAFT_21474 [Parachaetomium inaequale]